MIYPHLLSSLLLYTKNRRLATYNAMARVAASSFEVEQMIYLLEEMSQQGFVPNTTTLKHTIRQACEWGYPRLALQIAQKAEEESSFGFRLDQSAWVQILIASADNHYVCFIHFTSQISVAKHFPSCMVLRPHGSVSSRATPRTRDLSSPCSTPQADGVDPISHPPSLNSFPVLRKNITSALSSKHSATPAKCPTRSMSSALSAQPASHRHYLPSNRS